MNKYILSLATSFAITLGAASHAEDYSNLSPQEAFDSAETAFDAKDYKKAYGLIKYASDNGIGDAQVPLGFIHSHGMASSDEFNLAFEEFKYIALTNGIERDDKKALNFFLNAEEDTGNSYIWKFIGELYGTSEQVGIDYTKAIDALDKAPGNNKDRIAEFKALMSGSSSSSALKFGSIKMGDQKSRHRNCTDEWLCLVDGENISVEYTKSGYNYIISKAIIMDEVTLDHDWENLNTVIDLLDSKHSVNIAPSDKDVENAKHGKTESLRWFYRDFTIEVVLEEGKFSVVYRDDKTADTVKKKVMATTSSFKTRLDML